MTRRLALVAFLVVAVLGALAPKTNAAPLSAVSPVLVVHGFSATGATDCRRDPIVGAWSEGLRKRGLPVITVAYYRGDTNCDVQLRGRADNTINTSIGELGRELAWLVHDDYTVKGRSVRISAHSMGGVIARAALSGVVQHRSGFPRQLLVSDVVTSGSPHKGTPTANKCGPQPVPRQCIEVRPGSQLLARLAHNPQASKGTDWTLTGSERDEFVPVSSALGMRQVSSRWPAISRVRYKTYNHAQLVTEPVALDRIAVGLRTDR